MNDAPVNPIGLVCAPNPRAAVAAIPPYIPGEAKAEGASKVIKLSSNESALGPSPMALEALRAATASAHLYPDANSEELRGALARKFKLHFDQIMCGCGSEEILHLIARAFVDAGDEVVVSQFGFIGHHIAGMAAGGKLVKVPETDFKVDLDAMLASVTTKTKVVFIANPGNPTGTMLPLGDIKAFHSALPDNILLVLDAAYAEFAQSIEGYGSGASLVEAGAANVIVTRTFSKMHGLAALRVGWAYGAKEVISFVNRVRPAFNTNALAQAAACAALDDDIFVNEALRVNDEGLSQMTRGLERSGLAVTPSVCNFVLAHVSEDSLLDCESLFDALRRTGVIVRPVGGYGLANSLRISVGTREDNDVLLDALELILGQDS